MNKFAIITGASRGIGLGVAKYFAQHGYDLALIARDPERLETARTEILKHSTGIDITIHSIDISNSHKTYNNVKDLITKKGHVDVVFNSAGILVMGGIDVDIDDFERLHAINVNGMFAVAKAAAEKMKQQQSGYILNLASLSGKQARIDNGAYASSKFAVVGFSAALFKELMPYNIKVTTLCPSVIDTDMTVEYPIPNEQKIQVSDIVDTVDYLLKLTSHAVISSVDIQCKAIVESGI